jgi:hypothetical protein
VTGVNDELWQTRRAWHGVAELLLAGPQYRRSGTIRLRITPGGFATVKDPDLRVDLDHLVVAGQWLPMAGLTYRALAERAGVDVGAPEGLYADGSGAGPGEPVELSPAAAQVLADAFGRADAALRALAPEQTPVLWPEHFDVGVTVDEVNYGVSAGDSYLREPYAYVGPWKPRTGTFWNAPFGAVRAMAELPDAATVSAFFAEGREHATADPVADG